MRRLHSWAALVVAVALTLGAALGTASNIKPAAFHLEEASIAQIQQAILARKLTSEQLVKLYLNRVKAYNGTCVLQPEGILGPVQTVPHAGQINALSTLNLRPAARKSWGFDDRKARSMTDDADADPKMPDALEAAIAQDQQFARTGKLVGPLHGVVMAVKDQYDTLDMRTTAGADAYSPRFDFARMMAPAARSRATNVESSGGRSFA